MRKADETANLMPSFVDVSVDETGLKSGRKRSTELTESLDDASFANKMLDWVETGKSSLTAQLDRPERPFTSTLSATTESKTGAGAKNGATTNAIATDSEATAGSVILTNPSSSSVTDSSSDQSRSNTLSISATALRGSVSPDGSTRSSSSLSALGLAPQAAEKVATRTPSMTTPGIAEVRPTNSHTAAVPGDAKPNDLLPGSGVKTKSVAMPMGMSENGAGMASLSHSAGKVDVKSASGAARAPVGQVNTGIKGIVAGHSHSRAQVTVETQIKRATSAKTIATVDMARQSQQLGVRKAVVTKNAVAKNAVNKKLASGDLSDAGSKKLKKIAQSNNHNARVAQQSETAIVSAQSPQSVTTTRPGVELTPNQSHELTRSGAVISHLGGDPASGSSTTKSADGMLELAPIETPPDQPAFKTQLSERVSIAIRQGLESARIQLNPQELGPVQIELSLEGQQAFVSFNAAHVETREAIRQSLDELRANLNEQGLELAGADVSDEKQDSSSSQERPRANDEAQVSGSMESNRTDSGQVLPAQQIKAASAGAGAVDLFV